MAKQASKKTGAIRNPDRPNGKAWSKRSRHGLAGYDSVGHNATGRTKPSGHSVKGMKVDYCGCAVCMFRSAHALI